MLKTRRLEKLNKLALRFYLEQLQKSKRAQEYLYSRVDKKIAEKFFVGYASPNGFIEYLNGFNISKTDAHDSGLVLFDYDGNAWPRFSNRIMFPIIHAGTLVGFGGRTLGETTKQNPKYINSKASLLYNKGEVLYGLWKARKSIELLGYVFLVEGYFDVLGLTNNKVYNCVGLCGTALTKGHAAQLKRYTKNVYVMLDSDSAGRLAAQKAKKILKRAHIYRGRILLPDKFDPDDYVKKYGRKALNKLKILK